MAIYKALKQNHYLSFQLKKNSDQFEIVSSGSEKNLQAEIDYLYDNPGVYDGRLILGDSPKFLVGSIYNSEFRRDHMIVVNDDGTIEASDYNFELKIEKVNAKVEVNISFLTKPNTLFASDIAGGKICCDGKTYYIC